MQKAFTITELIFVIIIIGILSAIAIPKFQKTSVLAYDSKAGSQLSAVMSALATERQKRILKGDFNGITALGEDSYAFSKFNADASGTQNDVVQNYVSNCGDGDKGCWTRDGTSYTYTFADSGSASYKLESNKLKCDNDAADCARLLR